MPDFTLRKGFWQCDECGALVILTSVHHAWHERHWPSQSTLDAQLKAKLDEIEAVAMSSKSEYTWIKGEVGGWLYQMPGITGDEETDRWSREAGLWNHHRGTKPESWS